jgi:hypothetical protein
VGRLASFASRGELTVSQTVLEVGSLPKRPAGEAGAAVFGPFGANGRGKA